MPKLSALIDDFYFQSFSQIANMHVFITCIYVCLFFLTLSNLERIIWVHMETTEGSYTQSKFFFHGAHCSFKNTRSDNPPTDLCVLCLLCTWVTNRKCMRPSRIKLLAVTYIISSTYCLPLFKESFVSVRSLVKN